MPTAMAVRSPNPAPALRRASSTNADSSSPCLRASTADTSATATEPSCSATVTAGVAESSASSSTTPQPSEVAIVVVTVRAQPPPAGSGHGLCLNPGHHVLSRRRRPCLQRGNRGRAEARRLLRRQLHADQHVPFENYYGDDVTDDAGCLLGLIGGEGLRADIRQRGYLRRRQQ